MKKIDKFILKAFIGPFIAILLVVIFILMMQFLWLYIDELVGKGLSLRIILEFLMWGIFTILPLALPLATLLASMMVIGQMAENNELLAIRAAGVSFGRVMIPLTIASFLISVGAFFAGNDLVPKAYNEIYTLRDDIGRTKDEIKIPSGTFYEGIDNYVLRVESQDDETGMLRSVMVYDHTGRKGNTSLTLADSAMMKMSVRKDYLTFTLFHGSNYKEDNTRNSSDTTLQLQRINFDRQELIIPLANYSFEKSDSNRFGDQSKSMKLGQLKHEHDSINLVLKELNDKHYRMMSTSTAFDFRIQLDTARKDMLQTREKLALPDNLPHQSVSAMIESCAQASTRADRLKSDAEMYQQDCYEPLFWLRRVDIDLLKKFAQAIACFILFFIGAPLGALIKKGGLGVSAIVSVLFFVLYWVVDISGNKLARDGAISASAGVFISALVLAPIGVFLTWKAIHDAELFGNADSIKSWWRKFKSKVMRFFHPTRIVYMGTPEFAVAPLDNLIRHKYKIVGVVTVADKPSGRGLQVNESAVKKYAVAHGIPVLQPLKLKDPEFLEALRAWKADMFVVVAFRMLPEEVWTMPKLGTFNLHAALLPQYRGAAPINWAVINGERMTGVTTFMIDKDIDTGGIILRQECRISPTDNVGDVHDKLMEIGSELVVTTVEGLIQHNVETRVQRSFIQGSEILKPAPKLTRELCHIDWNDSTDNIYNLIRGLSPYPAAFTELVQISSHPSAAATQAAPAGSANIQEEASPAGQPAWTNATAGKREEASKPVQLKIYETEKVDLKGVPGQILSDGRSYLAIATADGALSIKDLQLSGKKRMDVKTFLLGFRDPQSYAATSGTSRAEMAKARHSA